MTLTVAEIVAGLKKFQPLNIIKLEELFPVGKKVGLVITDEVDGFCKPGCGALAPPVEDEMVEGMISVTNALAQAFDDKDYPILVLQECHVPGKPEAPYPPHCEEGSGEELLVDKLKWLNESKNVTIVKKSCINGVIGAFRKDGTNKVFDWVNQEELEIIINVGICADICELQFVQGMLSARNIDFMPTLKDIIVHTKGCATYGMSVETAREYDLPDFMAHEQEIAQYMGLYLMQMSGAILVE